MELVYLLVLAPVALWIYLYPWQERSLPYRNLPGPAPTSGMFGNLLDLQKTPIATRYTSLTDRWGTTLRFRALFGKWRVVSTDIVAVSYVLRHTGLFHRHPSFNAMVERIVGPGVLVVEDEPHRRQRRVLNSAFNGNSVNNMMPMMWEEAYTLKAHVDKVGFAPPFYHTLSDMTHSSLFPARARPRSTCCKSTSAQPSTSLAARASTTALTRTLAGTRSARRSTA